MKNMGLSRLVLVDPGRWRTPEAWNLAWNSQEILENAEVHDSLSDALKGAGFLLGTSSRSGHRTPCPPRRARKS